MAIINTITNNGFNFLKEWEENVWLPWQNGFMQVGNTGSMSRLTTDSQWWPLLPYITTNSIWIYFSHMASNEDIEWYMSPIVDFYIDFYDSVNNILHTIPFKAHKRYLLIGECNTHIIMKYQHIQIYEYIHTSASSNPEAADARTDLYNLTNIDYTYNCPEQYPGAYATKSYFLLHK